MVRAPVNWRETATACETQVEQRTISSHGQADRASSSYLSNGLQWRLHGSRVTVGARVRVHEQIVGGDDDGLTRLSGSQKRWIRLHRAALRLGSAVQRISNLLKLLLKPTQTPPDTRNRAVKTLAQNYQRPERLQRLREIQTQLAHFAIIRVLSRGTQVGNAQHEQNHENGAMQGNDHGQNKGSHQPRLEHDVIH